MEPSDEVAGHQPDARRRRSRGPWLLGGVVVVGAVVAIAIGFFGVHTLFIDDVVQEEGPEFASGATLPATTSPATSTSEAPTEEATTTTTTAAAPAVQTLATGAFAGDGRYSAEGTAVVLTDGSEQRFVRFEDDFSVDNGPDLFVYLGTGSRAYGDPDEYVELGVLRGNIGSQNYEIPAVHPETGEPIDLARFDHVVVWCKRFDATFALARLA